MKVKKSIFTVCLMIMLLLSSILLFACGNNELCSKAYKSYESLITTMKQNASLFSSGKIGDNSVDFCLNDFHYKNSNDQEVAGYNNYVILASVGLEFIEEYYPVLANMNFKTDISGLKNDVSSLKKSYEKLDIEHSKFKNNATNLDYTIYNGYFARYRNQAQKFINQTYDTALTLGKFLFEKTNLKKSVGDKDLTLSAFNFYIDYNILMVFDDFREFFMDSCKGVIADDILYTSNLALVTAWASDVFNQKYKTLTTTEIASLKLIFGKINAERVMVNKALNKFSVYKFANNYSGSVEAYQKANSSAGAYYERILDYFYNAENTLYNFSEYLFVNVIA